MADKFIQLILAIAMLAVVVALLLGAASLARGRHGDRVRAIFFVGPTVALVAVGLVWPTILTIEKSFRGLAGTGSVSVSNYVAIFTRGDLRTSIINTAVWVLLPVYGIFPALTDGISRAWISNLAPDRARTWVLGVHGAP